MTTPVSRADAERILGPDVMTHIRRIVDEAPPLSEEQKTRLRALFRSARKEGARSARQTCEHETADDK